MIKKLSANLGLVLSLGFAHSASAETFSEEQIYGKYWHQAGGFDKAVADCGKLTPPEKCLTKNIFGVFIFAGMGVTLELFANGTFTLGFDHSLPYITLGVAVPEGEDKIEIEGSGTWEYLDGKAYLKVDLSDDISVIDFKEKIVDGFNVEMAEGPEDSDFEFYPVRLVSLNAE